MSGKPSLVQCFLVVFAILLIGEQAKAAKCDKDGNCKYGGKCVKNRCVCKANCRSKLWNAEYYCGLKHSRVKVFKNICELNNQACLIQKDIPIIKLTNPSKHHYQKTCKVSKPSPEVKLCDNPITHFDMCNSRKSNGICLENIKIGKFCSCPTNRLGSACDVINPYKGKIHDSGAVESNLSIIILIASMFASVLILVFAIIWRHRKKSKKSEIQSLFKNHKKIRSQDDLLLTPKNRKNQKVINDETNSNQFVPKSIEKQNPR